MTLTYIHYLFNKELEAYVKNNDIQIIEVIKKMDLGAIVRFTCDNEKVLNKIFEDC